MATSREARFKRLAQERGRRLRTATESLDEAVKLIDAAPDAGPLQERVRTLNERVHRILWDQAATAAGVDPARLDDLWKLAPPEIGDGDPDPKAIAKHVAASVKGRESLVMKPAEEEGDDDEGDEEEEAPSVFNLAKKAPKPKTTGAEAEATAKVAKSPATPAPKLGKGEGGARGTRDDHKVTTMQDVVDSDFAKTGRTDPFKL